jgi:P-type Cu2+ transporter
MAHNHDKHAGHSPEMFRHRFWLSSLLTLPILYFDQHVQAWFGYQAVAFPGAAWVQPLLSVGLYLYGGGVFVQGAIRELNIRQPGMMTLIGLAISVAFVYSLAVSLALLAGMPLYWELATLIVVMLLGHWIEIASVQGASRALEHLAALLPLGPTAWWESALRTSRSATCRWETASSFVPVSKSPRTAWCWRAPPV